MVKKLIAIILIFAATSVAWLALGAVTEARTRTSYTELGGAVGELWGMPHCQAAPEVFTLVPAPAAREGKETALERVSVPLTSTDAVVRLDLEYRRKGLLWFSTYNVSFFGTWTAVNTAPEPRKMVVVFRFPSPEALYDGFSLTLNGVEVPARYSPEEGGLEGEVTVD
ncbi:MAG: hypothetical protein K6U08_09500, partial [Firmicutes bacterium]|nr:hypothetical protein [Bacillota bacterium]